MIRTNTLWNLAGAGLPLLVALSAIPYLLETLGGASFGVVTILWVLIGYLSVFDLGVGRALTHEVAKINIVGESIEARRVISAGLLITLGTGVFGMFSIYYCAELLATRWLSLDPNIHEQAALAFKFAALAIVPTTLTSGYRGALEGLNRFAESNSIRLVLGAAMFGLPVIAVLMHGPSLTYISLYLSCSRLFGAVVGWVLLRRSLGSLCFSGLGGLFSKIIGYGSWMTLTGIIGPVMVYGDRFLLSATMGAAALPAYVVPQEALMRILIIPSSYAGALFPHFSGIAVSTAALVYRQALVRASIVMVAICVSVVALVPWFLSVWISPNFSFEAAPVAQALCIGIIANGIALVPYTLLQAMGRPKITAIFHLIELPLYLGAFYWLASTFGVIGAAWAWVGRAVLDLLLLLVAAKMSLRRG